MLAGTLTGYAGRAYAACVNVGGTTYECSGTNTTPQVINANNSDVTTTPRFNVNVTGNAQNAITVTGDGNLSYTDTYYSSLTATGPQSQALRMTAYGGSIAIDTNGALTGVDFGIASRLYGGSAITIVADGDVTATGQYGIAISARSNGSGASTITTGPGTTVATDWNGFSLNNSGNGTMAITVNGDVTAGNLAFSVFGNTNNTGNTQPVTIDVGFNSIVSGGYQAMYFRGTPASVTVAGAVYGGTGGAIQFGVYNDELELQPGSVVEGAVNGGNGSDSLCLAGAARTVSTSAPSATASSTGASNSF